MAGPGARVALLDLDGTEAQKTAAGQRGVMWLTRIAPYQARA